MHNHSSDLRGDGLHTLLAGVINKKISKKIRQDRTFLGAFIKTGKCQGVHIFFGHEA